MKRPDKMSNDEQEILKGMLNIIICEDKEGTSVKLSFNQVENEVFLNGYVNVLRRDRHICDLTFTQKGLDYIVELKALKLTAKDIEGFYWYDKDKVFKALKKFDPINTKFIAETRGSKDQNMLENIADFKKSRKKAWGFSYALCAANVVDSIIDGKVSFNQKEIDKYVKSSTSRQKCIAKKVVGYSWKLDQVNWDRETGKISGIQYYCNEINASITINGDELYSYKASIQHALKHNKQEVLNHLRNSTPPEMMILFTEAILGGMKGVRDIINDAPSVESKELDNMKTGRE
jgi:hypothetical protein